MTGFEEVTTRRGPLNGARIVTRSDGLVFDIVESPSSSYLLPELAGSSLVRKEVVTGLFGRGCLHFDGARVQLERLDARVEGSFHSALEPGIRPLPLPRVGQHSAELDMAASEQAKGSTVDGPADASVSTLATRVAGLADLGDGALAEIFGVERETFWRWRKGHLRSPRVANHRRLALLSRLLEEVATTRVNVREWLMAPSSEGPSPYEMLVAGRVDEVAKLAATAGAVTDRVVSTREEVELAFGEDDTWEPYLGEDDG